MTLLRSQLVLQDGDEVILRRHDRPSMYAVDNVTVEDGHEHPYFAGVWRFSQDGRGLVQDEDGEVLDPSESGWFGYVQAVNGVTVVDDIFNPLFDDTSPTRH